MELSWITWLAIGLLLMALEIVVPALVLFWFGVGAVLAALFVLIGVLSSAEAQWIFFFLSSLAFLAFWHFYLKKHFRKDREDDYLDPTLTNLLGTVTREIRPGIPGEVELHHNFHGLKKWTAESGENIGAGEEVVVLEAKGIKLVVKRNGDGK